jgi:hypothetical protein
LASRYVDRLTSQDDGLVLDDVVPLDALSTILGLRRRYLPTDVDGVDPLANALSPEAGLIAAPVAG